MGLSDVSYLSVLIGVAGIAIGYITQLVYLNKSEGKDAGVYLKTLESSRTLIVGGFILIFLGLLVEALSIILNTPPPCPTPCPTPCPIPCPS